ncbi:MAG: DUF1192 domain-containing protein [Alphaproteobacteria bacterium]
MDIEELEPRKKEKPMPRKLDDMGIDELAEYLAELNTETERVKAEIEGKKSYMAGAEALFKG